MLYYTVIDTNVLVAGMLKKKSIPNLIIRKAISENIIPIFNEEILQEYREVTARPKFNFPQEAVANLSDCLIQRGII